MDTIANNVHNINFLHLHHHHHHDHPFSSQPRTHLNYPWLLSDLPLVCKSSNYPFCPLEQDLRSWFFYTYNTSTDTANALYWRFALRSCLLVATKISWLFNASSHSSACCSLLYCQKSMVCRCWMIKSQVHHLNLKFAIFMLF